MTVFEKSKWIWHADGETEDSYVEFKDTFTYESGRVTVRLSCDTDYTLFINGSYAASGQYGDFEHYKIYDTLDVTELVTEGENTVEITVYHCGVSTSRYRPASAGLIYEIECDGKTLAYSREDTPSRVSPSYVSGRKLFVSSQLGFSFSFDATKDTSGGYTPSACVEKNCSFFPRPIKKAALLDRKPMKRCDRLSDTHYLIDLGGETVGLPMLELFSESEQNITVAWGEHIVDGGVRKMIGNRNFFFEYRAKKGENIFTEYMLRIGCRYLEIFSERPIELRYVGVIPQIFEVRTLPYRLEDETEQRIYDICENTLRLCMMEHYVDCPWREQALYAFDSRNQMLCGYYCFDGGNAEYARANLKLIAEDRRDDGLLSICAPCGTTLAIPSFSLYWIVSMSEYVTYTGDTSLAAEYHGKMCAVIDEFISNSHDGLIYAFEGKEMWNFYDWSPYSSGTLGRSQEKQTDCVINCLFAVALDKLEQMCRATGKGFAYAGIADKLRARIKETFLTEKGVFTMKAGEEQYTELSNALAVLANAVTGEEARFICDAMTSGELIESSLSMRVLLYDALMSIDADGYGEYIRGDIKKNYKPMLDAGSDTVWETKIGESDFKNAGSLCHGWSAVPIYVYHRLSK